MRDAQGDANLPGNNSDDDHPVGAAATEYPPPAPGRQFGDTAKSSRMLRKEPQSVRAYSPEQQLRGHGSHGGGGGSVAPSGGGGGGGGGIGTRGVLWKHDDDQRLIELIEVHGEDDWKLITAEFNKGACG